MKLVIAEKPSVAGSIAEVLGANRKEDGFLEGNGYVVPWCVGHLVELAQPEVYDDSFKKWSYDSLPIVPRDFQYEVKSDVKKQFGIIKKLMARKDVESVVCATDAGREGELIFRLVFNQAKCNKPMERLWISSMEESAIRDGFHHLRPGHEYDNLYQSALARQKADWLVGLNGTRLFTVLYNGKVLKVGRVQTPTLAMLVDRETEIMNFKKEPFYSVLIDMDGIDASSEKMKSKEDAERISKNLVGKNAKVVDVRKEEKKVTPPKLYDLTTLQRDANRIFGFTAKQTLEATQSLYEKKYVTYPRTDSSYLSDDMAQTAYDVIGAIKKSMEFVNPAIMKDIPNVAVVMNSKKVTDHHAIIPTVEIAKGVKGVSECEWKVLHLIATRMLCATDQKHVYVSEVAELMAEDVTFKVTNKVIKEDGWKKHENSLRQYYKGSIVEEDEKEDEVIATQLSLKKDDVLEIKNATCKEGFTTPPKHYTEDSLLTDNVLKELKQSHNFETEKRKALSVEEQKLFLTFLRESHQYNHWYPIFAFMLCSGLRVGEATGLRWCDVDLKDKNININHTLVYYNHAKSVEGDKGGCYFGINTPKTEAGKRDVPMLSIARDRKIRKVFRNILVR